MRRLPSWRCSLTVVRRNFSQPLALVVQIVRQHLLLDLVEFSLEILRDGVDRIGDVLDHVVDQGRDGGNLPAGFERAAHGFHRLQRLAPSADQ